MVVAARTQTSRDQQQFEKFDIRNFTHQLEASKTKGKFICPVCGGNDLSIVPETGKYQCFNNCDCKDIREAIKPWAEVLAERHGNNYTPRQRRTENKPKARKPKPALISFGDLISIAMLPEPATDIPQPQQPTSRLPEGLPGSTRETKYIYSDAQWVVRYQWPDPNSPKGYDKTFRQWHRLPDGTPKMKKGDKPWKSYRQEEAIAAAKSSKSVDRITALLQHEGEGCVEVGRAHGLAGFTFQGSSWGKETITTEYQTFKDGGVGLIIFLHDADGAGLKKLKTCEDCAAEVGIPFIGINPHSICEDLPYKSGDIKEILACMDVSKFISNLEKEIYEALEQREIAEAYEGSDEPRQGISHSQNNSINFQAPYNPNDPEAAYKWICQLKDLPYENCVTAGTFDGWVYRKVFNKVEWIVLNSAFYVWSEEHKVWSHQDDAKAYKRVADAGEDVYKLTHSRELGWKVTKPYEANAHKESAFKYSRSRLELSGLLPNNTHLLGFKNCVIDLRTGETMPHSKDFYLTNIIPHEYEANKPCPEVYLKFLTESFGIEMVEVIRAFTSMFLDPTAPYGRFPHLIGISGGGKGTQGRLWSSFYGDEGSSSAAQFADISTPEGRHQYLTGKRIFGFPDLGGYADGVRAFYELVDNGAMSGRALFNPVAYSKQWYIRFWIASVNHLQIENAGDGWMRRAYPIPVKNRNVTTDPDLWRKLQEVKSDIISWALAMPREERDRILLSPPESDRAKNMALEASLYGDSTKSFVDLCLRPSNDGRLFVSQSLLHSWYVLYCKEHGYCPLGMSKFISHLKTVLPHNFKERSWTPTVNGVRQRIQSHFTLLWHLPNVLDVRVPEDRSDPSQPKSDRSQPRTEFWAYFKSECQEGGIEEFEQFWKPTKNPEPSHSTPVHPVQGQNVPVSNPGQAETLTQHTCPPCPSVHPKELTLRKEDRKNISENEINNFVDPTYKPKVCPDNVDNLDSLTVTELQPVHDILTPENDVDSVDSRTVTELQPIQDANPQHITASEPLRKRIDDAWDDNLKLGEIVIEADQDEWSRLLVEYTFEQITHINDAVIIVDKQNPDSLYPPGILVDPEKIADNAEYIRELIADSDWAIIANYTEKWKKEFKKAVWKKLSPEEHKLVKHLKELASNPESQEPNSSENLPSAENLTESTEGLNKSVLPDTSEKESTVPEAQAIVQPTSLLHNGIHVFQWKTGDRVDYLGEQVSVFEVIAGDEFVTVIRRNGEKFKAEKFLLFPFKSSDAKGGKLRKNE